jgi:hypothetical protein
MKLVSNTITSTARLCSAAHRRRESGSGSPTQRLTRDGNGSGSDRVQQKPDPRKNWLG